MEVCILNSNSIIRKVDDLGRIVIPKELRKKLNIKINDNIEMYIDNNNIIIRKYSKVLNEKELSIRICSLLSDLTNYNIIITDREKVIASSTEQEIIPLFKEVIEVLRTRSPISLGDKYVYPIIINSEILGTITIIGNLENKSEIKLLCDIIIKLLENKIDL